MKFMLIEETTVREIYVNWDQVHEIYVNATKNW